MVADTKLLFVLVGLPFSGKTTWAEKYSSEFKEIISRDEILNAINRDTALRQYLFLEAKKIIEPVSQIYLSKEQNAWNDVVTSEYVKQVKEKICNSISDVVIVDGTHLSLESRKFIAEGYGRKKIAIVFETPKEVCIERWKKGIVTGVRSTITEDLIDKMDNLRIFPQKTEGFDEVLLIE
ncbi:MAG: ATP-binding protein [Candidatus Levybacteria bacterium]|nr:ATP-binding protein [Candidatus Levybacteria bacterium]